MARPRTVDDDAVLDAAEAQLTATGTAGFTLQTVADRVGVSAAALVKRFGSKHALLVAIDRRWVAQIPSVYAAAVEPFDDPIERLRAAALVGFRAMTDATVAGNLLTGLARDLEHPELRALLSQGWRAMQRQIRDRLAEAIDAGALPAAPPLEQAARMLFALTEGTRLSWTVSPKGSLARRARADVDVLLASWSDRRGPGS